MDNIKTFRELHGLSISQLARLMGVAPSTAYRWENGQRWPKEANLEKLLDTLDVTPNDLLDK